MAQQVQPREERSLGQLFSDLSGDLSRLVREELSLPRAEVLQKGVSAARDLGLLLGGALYARPTSRLARPFKP